MSSPTILKVPSKDEARRWYKWALDRTHGNNPFHPTFHPTEGDNHAKQGHPNDIYFLAGITATTEPDHKPSKAPTVKALVAKTRGPVVYDDGNDKPTQKSPKTNVRKIEVPKGRPVYVPLSTELATKTKYPDFSPAYPSLAALAEDFIKSEALENNGIQPVDFELKDQKGNVIAQLTGNQVTSFLVTDSFDNLDVRVDNIFMLPAGGGQAAFYDHVVKIDTTSLSPGVYFLRFGITGKFFQYKVNYEINIV